MDIIFFFFVRRVNFYGSNQTLDALMILIKLKIIRLFIIELHILFVFVARFDEPNKLKGNEYMLNELKHNYNHNFQ